MKFFEPDILVEAEDGILEKIGLNRWRSQGFERCVFPLHQLLTNEKNRDRAELAVGQGIIDVLDDIYVSERRFELRDKREACTVEPDKKSLISETLFGVYPTNKNSRYIPRTFKGVFRPEVLEACPETWRKVFLEGAITPLRILRYKLENDRSWQHDPVVFVFDPQKTTDVIDLWNLRLESNPVIPVPVQWWPELVKDVGEIIADGYRPLQGNPNGVMHTTTIEFARSLDETNQKVLSSEIDPNLPHGSWVKKTWRNQIWLEPANEWMSSPRPLRVTATEKRTKLSVSKDNPPTVEFETLSPEFAPMYRGAHHARWINVVNMSGYGRTDVATTLPFNTFDPAKPRLDYLGESVVVGTEGWSFPQQYKDNTQTIQLQSHEEALIQSLKSLGIEARTSEPGHIAKQILNQLDGMWGIRVLKDPETLKVLNHMAGGIRRRSSGQEEVEEVFDRRTKPAKDWDSLIKRRQKRQSLPKIEISHFTDRNIIRLGLSTNCPRCTAANWHSLETVGYEVVCERCLDQYNFPQGKLQPRNGNWAYRVVGPFAAPDYARGSYGALLALHTLSEVSLDRDQMTFAPGLELTVDDGAPCEADYVAWIPRKDFGELRHPDLVIGEAKSFADGDLLKQHDFDQLKRMALKLRGCTIVISVMRDSFTAHEKEMLTRFVNWARRPDRQGRPQNPVVLLTGIELFHRFNISSTWKEKGGKYSKYADYQHTKSLRQLAEATQAIYLDLPPYYEDPRYVARMKRRRS